MVRLAYRQAGPESRSERNINYEMIFIGSALLLEGDHSAGMTTL